MSYERQEHFEKGARKKKGREVYAKRKRRGGVHVVKFGSEEKK